MLWIREGLRPNQHAGCLDSHMRTVLGTEPSTRCGFHTDHLTGAEIVFELARVDGLCTRTVVIGGVDVRTHMYRCCDGRKPEVIPSVEVHGHRS